MAKPMERKIGITDPGWPESTLSQDLTGESALKKGNLYELMGLLGYRAMMSVRFVSRTEWNEIYDAWEEGALAEGDLD